MGLRLTATVRLGLRRCAPVVLALLAVPALVAAQTEAPGAEEAEGPIRSDLEEKVDVQLVLIDFLAVDRQGRTVADVTVDELLLLVDSRDREIASLDLDCPAGVSDEPRPRSTGTEPASRPPSPMQPRRIILVFDYYHMTNVAEALEQAEAMLDDLPTGDEFHMVASLGEVVRIESPLTRDLDEVRWALKRMRNDPALYAGNYGRLTERRFFERIKVLFDLLESMPGRKTIVLFSGPFINDGFFYDPTFKELSGLSTATRTAIYPVDVGGLRTPTDPNVQPRGGPPMLRRLANETGGRMTADTNDITLAYARAHRDLGCTYTLGFYDHGPRLDRERRITIRPLRKGVRIVYPEFYVVRSPEERRESMFRTASMAPHMFESPEVKTSVVVMGPRSTKRWRTLFSIEIRPGNEWRHEPGEAWTLKGLLRKPNGTIVRSFKQRISPPGPDGDDLPVIAFAREIDVPPGRYIASAIVSGPAGRAPLARTRAVELPEIPMGSPFLIGPLIGHRAATAGDDPDDPRPGFEPLMDPEVRQGEPLDSLTLVCVAGASTPVNIRTIAREILAIDGTGALQLESRSARLPVSNKAHCHRVLDRVSTSALEPGRYEITAFSETSDFITGSGATEFTIRPRSPR